MKGVKRVKARKICSSNGEIHFVLKENEEEKNFECLDIFKMKCITKKEAEKPLILVRGE